MLDNAARPILQFLRWCTSVSHGPSLAMLDDATAATPRCLTTIRAHAREPTVLGPPEGCRVCVPCAARPPNPAISEGLQAVCRRRRLAHRRARSAGSTTSHECDRSWDSAVDRCAHLGAFVCLITSTIRGGLGISLARSQEKDASNTDLLAFEPSIAPSIEMRVPRLFLVSAVCTVKSASRSMGS
jgi:hypothetical protein